MPWLTAILTGVASLIGGAVNVAGAVVSTVGTVAGAGVSALGGLASGVSGLVFGTGLTGLTVGQQMAAIAEPAYYDTAGIGVLGGVTSATSKTADYLGNLMPTALGIYQLFGKESPIEEIIKTTMAKIEAPVLARVPVPSVPAPAITVPAPAITGPALPILGAQAPVVVTIEAPPKPEPNYLLYIGIAALILILLRKK